MFGHRQHITRGKEKVFGPRTAKDSIEKCMFYMILGSELSVTTATVFGDV